MRKTYFILTFILFAISVYGAFVPYNEREPQRIYKEMEWQTNQPLTPFVDCSEREILRIKKENWKSREEYAEVHKNDSINKKIWEKERPYLFILYVIILGLLITILIYTLKLVKILIKKNI